MWWRSPIFNLISQRVWGSPSKWQASGRAIIKLSKKEPCVVHGLSVFLFFRELRKIWPPARKKKLEENSGPDPLLQSSLTPCQEFNHNWLCCLFLPSLSSSSAAAVTTTLYCFCCHCAVAPQHLGESRRLIRTNHCSRHWRYCHSLVSAYSDRIMTSLCSPWKDDALLNATTVQATIDEIIAQV